VLWGLGMGAQASIIKAALVDMVPRERRGSGFGLFQMGFGLFWFAGSALMGVLYEISLVYLVVFSIAVQLLAVPLFWRVARQMGPQPRQP
jgi:MFS family permease